jgi:tRNA modification GTPase
MNVSCDDTIAALASAPGPAARGIVRISGPSARPSVEHVFQPDEPQTWRATRRAARHRGRLRLASLRFALPVSVYYWPNRRSYTGQPAAELHLVGSPPILESVLAALYASGVRPARPGEFTLRAFLAGRIDLVQAEAVLGVVDAHDHRELETALRQLAGGLSGQLGKVRGDLLDLLADLEAGLDFVDEDIQFVTREEVAGRLAASQGALETLLAKASERIQSTGRARVVLAGLPNAGKSALFNALAGRQAALVSEVEGTTRDYLSAAFEWGGAAIELIDTAGWESGVIGIAFTAQELRREQIAQADLVLWCTAADLDARGRAADSALRDALCRDNRPVLVVGTKCDLDISPGTTGLHVSAYTGSGLDELIEAVAERLTANSSGNRQFVGTAAARCRESLEGAIADLRLAAESASRGSGDEIVALEVREALAHLGSILGEIYTDDVLDRIFSRFCIGK